MFWWHWKHLGSMWHPAFTPPVDFLESQELGDMPCMRFHHAARPKQETWEIIRFQHQPLSKRVEFSFHPQEEKLCWKKKNSQTKGTNSIPTKKNWDPLLKNAKRFPNISHRICRCPTHPIHPHLQVTWSWLPMRTKPAASSKPQHHKPRKQSAMASQNTQVSCYQCWLQIPLDFIHIQYI